MIHAEKRIPKYAGTIPAKRCLQYATGGCNKRHRRKPCDDLRLSENSTFYVLHDTMRKPGKGRETPFEIRLILGQNERDFKGASL